MIMPKITDKTQMYDLLARGLLGNRFRIWDTEKSYKAAVDAGFDWLVGVRCVGVPGLPYYHHKTYEEATAIGSMLRKEYGCPVRYYEASPDQFITIQGEITDYVHGYGVEYSTEKTHMRAALAQERISVFDIRIPAIIRKYFNEPSLEDLYYIFNTYPGCTVEFTAYEILVGELPSHNVVIWEVRHY